ncbi:unnamed protein product [Acanthoscelides obtectus]|uniref:EGF-like domain-containing protein n=1 Tax=Acanthoscelides obtectus TaxID=200917 RepID=A0A9P0LXR9_ACAOB|nr:unnamed protein product [Acanthoscelides obtectus]CAK1669036.1 hypothetical protein AOBTE_LOCUS26754 [Acanthoscelides obtectus]
MNIVAILLLAVGAAHAHSPERCAGVNETYLEYKSCLSTCDDLEDDSCDGQTSYGPGCYCSKGFLRKDEYCIPKDRCNALGGRYVKCPENEIFLKYRSCRENCDQNSKNCRKTLDYRPGCYCAPGYRRKNGLCIRKEKCLDQRPEDSEEQCGENEVYLTFKPCLITCGDLVRYKVCNEKQYAPGCYCKQGYLRKEGRCVPNQECLESKKELLSMCGPNEEYLKYVPCLQSCSELERGTCNEEARRYAPGCYCAEGYVRRNGECISVEECSSVKSLLPRKCGSNEQYLEYEPCPKTCGDLASPECEKKFKKHAPGCYCREGYLRRNGVCIPRSHCWHSSGEDSKLCGVNEVFLSYKFHNENCDEQGKQKHDKIQKYAPGYPGYLRKGGICIPKEACSKQIDLQNGCDVNEEYYEYEPCQQTCNDLDSKNCDKGERKYSPGCYCREGYLMQNGICIPKEDCYNNAKDMMKECPINERFLIYKPCRERCDDSEYGNCDNSNQHAPGCYCAKGYLRKDGECVPEYQCSDSTESNSASQL